MRRAFIPSGSANLLLFLAAAAVLSGCPGNLDRPERFFMDAGDCSDVQKTIFTPTCGGAGCHENPGAASNLDLVSAGVATRLKAGTSTCQTKPIATYLLEKVKASPSCGARMPLGSDPLGPNELKCLEGYLARLGDGGM